VAARATRNPAAYDNFLRGNFQLARRTPESNLLAARSYEAAVAADPTFTDAVARIAYTYANALDNEFDIGIARDTLVARGIAMSERAMQLDSLSSDAWLAQAYIRMGAYPRTFEGVRERFERAIALNPRSAEAHHQFASYLMYMGDTAASARENRRALEIEPGRAISWHQLSNLAMQERRPAEGIRLADSALASDPQFLLAHLTRFYGEVALRDTAAARRSAQALPASGSFQVVGLFLNAFLDALGGDSSGMRTFTALVRDNPQSPTSTGNANAGAWGAMLFAQIGEREAAFAVLDAVHPRGGLLHHLMRYSLFDPIRAEPRFQTLFNETRPPGALW